MEYLTHTLHILTLIKFLSFDLREQNQFDWPQDCLYFHVLIDRVISFVARQKFRVIVCNVPARLRGIYW